MMIKLGKVSKATKGFKINWFIEPVTLEPGPIIA